VAPLVKQLCDAGLKAEALSLDVQDRERVRSAFDEIAERRGSIDVLANVHGIYHQAPEGVGPVEAESPEDWQRTLSVNLMGVIHTSEAALTHMKRQRSGRIVSVSSMAAVLGGIVSGAAYPVSKAGVTVFMKCVAREGGEYNITANSVAPGHVDTAMAAKVLERVPLEDIQSRTVLGRMGRPDEIASVIAFLASDDASYITGQMFGVNGGQLMA